MTHTTLAAVAVTAASASSVGFDVGAALNAQSAEGQRRASQRTAAGA